jgi:outer membrane lipoprotein-sorting protein
MVKRLKVFPQICVSIVILWAISGGAFADNSMETFQKAAGEIRSIKTDFTQEKHLPILAEPLISTGRFLFRAPDALRWEYTAPVKSILVAFKGKTRRIIQSVSGAPQSGQDAPFMDVVLKDISNWMTGKFDENPIFTVNPGERGTFALTPKNDTMAGIISKIELIPSERPGILSEVIVFESPDSYTRIRFQNTDINQAIADDAFTQTP